MICPEATVRVGPHVLTLRPNFRACYELERATGVSYIHTINNFCRQSIRAAALLLWCMSATSRSQDRLPINVTEHDLSQGLNVPGEFLDCIPVPTSQEFSDLRAITAVLLREAGMTEPVDEKKSLPICQDLNEKSP